MENYNLQEFKNTRTNLQSKNSRITNKTAWSNEFWENGT